MDTILIFLALLGCEPKATVVPSNSTFFLDGVVYVRPDMLTPPVLVHELYHDCQWQAAGRQNATTLAEWRNREYEAMTAERLFFDKYGGLKLNLWYSY
jgi:antirestriction protein